MDLADSIRKHGFKRWYERQLGESVLCFVTCFLCMITVAACLEEFGSQVAGPQSVLLLSMAVVAGGIGAASWRRFKQVLARAEEIGDHATCSECGAYAKFSVLAPARHATRSPWTKQSDHPNQDIAWLRVRCNKCGHEWTLQ